MNRARRYDRWKWLALAAVLAVGSSGCGETESAGLAPATDAGTGGSAGTAGSGGTGGDLDVNGAGGAGAPNYA
ncbi:MAG: hypothetical protein HKN10_02395, partial [Myxococcales bacterium]|nr:hypothetical protein [Myxococcales bacterium]